MAASGVSVPGSRSSFPRMDCSGIGSPRPGGSCHRGRGCSLPRWLHRTTRSCPGRRVRPRPGSPPCAIRRLRGACGAQRRTAVVADKL